MKTKVNFSAGSLALIAGFFLFSFFRGVSAEPAKDEFKLVKSEQNINLFIRPIPLSEGYTVRQLKAVLYVRANPDEVVELIRDEKNITTWMKAVRNCKSLLRTSDDQWITYLIFSVPWPLNDQDCIFRFKKTTQSSGAVILEFSSDPNYMAAVDGIKRMKGIKGTWIITPMGDGTCRVEYSICSYTKPSMPKWLTDPIIQGNLISSMSAFRDHLNH